ERRHIFKNHDGSTVISLGSTALGLQETEHKRRENFFPHISLAIKAVLSVFDEVMPRRLGLRYINEIDRDAISKELGREVPLEQIINPSLHKPLAELADMQGTHFASEIRSAVDDLGMLTLRYGVTPSGEKSTYRIDLDRYLEGEMRIDAILDLLQRFGNDIYDV